MPWRFSSRRGSSARAATGSSSRSSCRAPKCRFSPSATGDAVPLPTARDYKKVYDGDRGPNTGGMGGHSPAGILDAPTSSRVMKEILWPTLRGLAAEGRLFTGVLYAGIMLTESGPKILEFNARFGDPETEVIVPRLQSDLAGLLLGAARGELDRFPPLEIKPEACAGIVLCAGGYPGSYERGKPIRGLNDAAKLPSESRSSTPGPRSRGAGSSRPAGGSSSSRPARRRSARPPRAPTKRPT